MRRFSAEYLRTTREGMWDDSRAALAPLELDTRSRVLDVGCGTGELTAVLRGETPGEVVGIDVDRTLLSHAEPPVLQGDALRLPFADDTFDLVVCQALLVNLPDPEEAIREFSRVSSDLVAAIEPDNEAVSISSTADAEARLAGRARELFLAGNDTDAALGDVSEVFERVGLEEVTTRRYDHEQLIEPPYSETAVEGARRKATGEALTDDRETMLAGDTTEEELDDLRQAWRAMGREVIDQMQSEEYRRRETVPFYVTVGRV